VKAIVIDGPDEVSYREVETPTCGPEDVLVRSSLAGICRTDIDVATGLLTDPRWVRLPVVPGHEWSGTIEQVGANVTDLHPGQCVVCEGLIPCRRCGRCREGATHLCEKYDSVGFTRGGGYGEFVLVPRHVVHALPEHVSLEEAVLVEPGSVVLRGLERGRLAPGEALGVIGIGTLGALGIALAPLFSPRAIVAFGLRDEELELADRLGATHTVKVDDLDAVEETERLFGSRLDMVLETAGAPAAVDAALRLPREGGRTVLLGICGEGRAISVAPDAIVLRDIEIIGSVAYTSTVWSRLLRVIAARLVDVAPIVTRRYPVDRFEEAFELMESDKVPVGRIVLEHPPG
jgi:D-arabinose 1-dehydrogenase-like Zn-dependent alcohol dehydrogenase